jgi:3-hydroxyisobutyrate dehydrogenase-like beta-hydroxyacid dehydrogenase
MMKIAVLGLGIIGSAWAKNLIADEHEVRCWNRTPKDFPNFTPSIQEAVAGAEAIFVLVSDPAAVQSVLEQIVPELRPGQLVIQSSTISAEWTVKFDKMVRGAGALFLEAPFTGGKLAAEKRQTVYYLGGDLDVVERARPILKSIAGAIQHIGPLGTASSLKLAMNLNIAGVAQTLCESLILCRAAGISDETYFQALSRNSSRSGTADQKEPKLRQRDYSPQFSLKHMGKDLRLALEKAASFSLALPQTAHLKQTYDQGINAGWKEDDFIGLIRYFER